MTKHECAMCQKIFNANDIDAYEIPEAYTFEPNGTVWITLHLGTPTSMELKTVHLCKECAEKIINVLDK